MTAGGSGSSGTVPHLNAAAAPDRLAAGDASMGLARSRTGPPFATGSITLRIVDHTRSVQLPNGQTVPRTLRTIVRYPASDRTRSGDLRGAAPARDAGPFPLIVFGHGFAVTPHLYARLLRAWAAAGYVVAAPVFPLGNADAPGGPNESDLPNQPADMSLVISRLLAASRATSGTLGGLISTHAIAVAGQSDGGDTALAVAYDPRYRDARVGAAIILSGAEIPGIGGFQIQAGGPPLLATQGSADTVNPPSATDAFYATAAVPKFLLTLPGATHLPPYSSQQPQLGVVERVTIAFLNHYLKRRPLKPLLSAGQVPGVAVLSAHP
ncbi:MAG: alpha/beta hydrolase family protein [Solirubrobacteraceae bacterium]